MAASPRNIRGLFSDAPPAEPQAREGESGLRPKPPERWEPHAERTAGPTPAEPHLPPAPRVPREARSLAELEVRPAAERRTAKHAACPQEEELERAAAARSRPPRLPAALGGERVDFDSVIASSQVPMPAAGPSDEVPAPPGLSAVAPPPARSGRGRARLGLAVAVGIAAAAGGAWLAHDAGRSPEAAPAAEPGPAAPPAGSPAAPEGEATAAADIEPGSVPAPAAGSAATPEAEAAAAPEPAAASEPAAAAAPEPAAASEPAAAAAREPAAAAVREPAAAAEAGSVAAPEPAREPAAAPEPPPAGDPEPASVAEADRDLPATPSRSQVESAMQTVRPAVRECAPGARGQTVPVRVTLHSSGRVTTALVSGRLAGTPEGSCIARAVRRAEVPAFTQPRLVVDYPFVL